MNQQQPLTPPEWRHPEADRRLTPTEWQPPAEVWVHRDAMRTLGPDAAYLMAVIDARWVTPENAEERRATIGMSLREVRRGLRRLREEGIL